MTQEDIMTSSEIAESVVVKCSPFSTPNHDPRCRKEHLRLKYAFKQSAFETVPATHMWHVMSDGPFRHSTLSMEGLRQWKLL